MMDRTFNVTGWRQTKPPELGDPERSHEELTNLIHNLTDQTTAIVRHPYDPNNWLQRSKTLRRLRYPELAVGDAYKASALSRSHLSYLDSNCEAGWRLGCRMGFWMKDDCVQHEEAVDLLQQYLAQLQAHAHRAEVDNMYLFPNAEEGRFRRRMYPWISECHRKRSDELICLINQEFANNPANGLTGEAFCFVQRDAFGVSAGEDQSSDLLGVFAAQDIYEGDIILIDKTRIWGCNGPGSNGDCTSLGGGRGCGDPIHPNAEYDDSDMDLRWIRDKAGKTASSVLLNVRLLLCCIQDGFGHPLDHPLVARLTPTYAEDKVENFSLENDIVSPNEALRRFGIDIFANQNFDTWVLFTIQARAFNNSCGDPMSESLNPLFSLFNHSCEPNVEWTTTSDHRTIKVKARENITEGEQLLVEYDQFMRNQPLEARRQRMMRWLDGPCLCTRCVREEQEECATKKGKHDQGSPGWDIPDEVVFPEDLLNLKNQRTKLLV